MRTPDAIYLDAREIIAQFDAGDAPTCLPTGDFFVRQHGARFDWKRLEALFKTSGTRLLDVQLLRIDGAVDIVYHLAR